LSYEGNEGGWDITAKLRLAGCFFTFDFYLFCPGRWGSIRFRATEIVTFKIWVPPENICRMKSYEDEEVRFWRRRLKVAQPHENFKLDFPSGRLRVGLATTFAFTQAVSNE
jgi:hypothetical protein